MQADAVDEHARLLAAHGWNDVELSKPRRTGDAALPGFMEKTECDNGREGRPQGQPGKSEKVEHGKNEKARHEAEAGVEARRDQNRYQQRRTGGDAAEDAEEGRHVVLNGMVHLHCF